MHWISFLCFPYSFSSYSSPSPPLPIFPYSLNQRRKFHPPNSYSPSSLPLLQKFPFFNTQLLPPAPASHPTAPPPPLPAPATACVSKTQPVTHARRRSRSGHARLVHLEQPSAAGAGLKPAAQECGQRGRPSSWWRGAPLLHGPIHRNYLALPTRLSHCITWLLWPGL